MPRATNNVAAKARKKKYLRAAKGYFGARHRLYKTARQAVEKGWCHAYNDRKLKKREFRSLWIIRINAGCRINGISYSRFIDAMHKANITVDRKLLAHLAWHEPEVFAQLCMIAKGELSPETTILLPEKIEEPAPVKKTAPKKEETTVEA